MTSRSLRVGLVALGVVLGGIVAPGAAEAPALGQRPSSAALPVAVGVLPGMQRPVLPFATVRREGARRPLAGVRIALDPGHQLGNHNFPRQTHRLVPAGGFRKQCNTTGTATNGGYPEATLNYRVVRAVQRRLERLGARVLLTRTTNRQDRWGPCVDRRGRFGGRHRARLMVSVHGDGAAASAHGFHVIAPARRAPWTTDIARGSLRLAKSLRRGLSRAGVPRSSYVRNALSVRGDLGTLNLSSVPVAMVELGNMRNRADAHRMTTRHGRAVYARALVRGIRHYLRR